MTHFLRALEELPEPVKAGFQHLLVIRDPRCLFLQPARTELAAIAG